MKCSHIWWDLCENHKLPPDLRLRIQKYGSLALPFLALSLATIFMLLSSGHDIMNLFTNNFHRAFRRFYRTTCFLNFGAINFFFQNFFFINVTYCLNNVELWKHGFSSPLCQILKSLLIEILEIMITIRKKKEKPKVRLEPKFHKILQNPFTDQ